MKNKRYLLVALAVLLLTLAVSAVAFASYTSLTFNALAYEVKLGTSKGLYSEVTKVGTGSLVWTSSDAQIATVGSGGWVYPTGDRLGTVTITVADSENPAVAASCTVTVTDQPVTAITFTQSAFALGLDEGIQLSNFVRLTQAGSFYGVGSINWVSNDDSIVSVDGSGYAYSGSSSEEGTTTVTATITHVAGTVATQDVAITVAKKKLTSIQFAKAAYTIKYGSSKRVQLIAKPVNVGGYSDDLTFESSDITVATVDSSGNVSPQKPGTVTITATYEPDAATVLTASTTVTIESKPIKKITLSRKSVSFIAGRSYIGSKSVRFTVEPSDAYWDQDLSYWESSDEEIFTVNGGTTASFNTYKTGKGKATVYVFDGTTYHKASCDVEVTNKKTGITLNKTKLSIPLKKVADEEVASLGQNTLTAYSAEDGSVLSGVKWTSSNKKVATVNQSGVVKAVKAGSAVITATAQDGSTAKCKVTVKQYKVTSLAGVKTLTMRVGWSQDCWDYLTVKPNYSYLFNPIFTYSSSNDDVVSINDDGRMVANSVGTATITAKAGDGSKKSFSFKVKVIEAYK